MLRCSNESRRHARRRKPRTREFTWRHAPSIKHETHANLCKVTREELDAESRTRAHVNSREVMAMLCCSNERRRHTLWRKSLTREFTWRDAPTVKHATHADLCKGTRCSVTCENAREFAWSDRDVIPFERESTSREFTRRDIDVFPFSTSHESRRRVSARESDTQRTWVYVMSREETSTNVREGLSLKWTCEPRVISSGA